MDEWHDFKVISNLYKHLTPNIPEANGNGFVFYYLFAGLLLVPYMLLGVTSPFLIGSPVEALLTQERLFSVFRINALLFGLFTIYFLTKIAREHLKTNGFVTVFFFTFTPIWLSLSNYVKYDIPSLFWVVVSLYLMMEYGKKEKLKYFVGAGVTTALAIATKASGIPLFGVYIFSYFLYTPQSSRRLGSFLAGIITALAVFVIAGVPDLLIGRGSYGEYFWANLVRSPATSSNYILGSQWYVFLLKDVYPGIFGHPMIIMFAVSLLYLLFFVRNKSPNVILVLFSLLIFSLSLVPLKLFAWGARTLVLLPHMALLISIFLSRLKLSKVVVLILFVGMVYQLSESLSWVSIKLMPDPRSTSSAWIQKNVVWGSIIGVENIPVYQSLPDVVNKEYHQNLYNVPGPRKFRYEIVDANSNSLPQTVVVSDADIAVNYFDKSPKKDLVSRLRREGYKEEKFFAPLDFYKFFGTEKMFFFSKLVPTPVSISVFLNKN